MHMFPATNEACVIFATRSPHPKAVTCCIRLTFMRRLYVNAEGPSPCPKLLKRESSPRALSASPASAHAFTRVLRCTSVRWGCPGALPASIFSNSSKASSRRLACPRPCKQKPQMPNDKGWFSSHHITSSLKDAVYAFSMCALLHALSFIMTPHKYVAANSADVAPQQPCQRSP